MSQPLARLVPASPDQRRLIANLVQLYLYDMTESMPFPIGADGRFDYGFLDRFWRFPYLIYVGEEIAGFALVIDECPLTGRSDCFFVAEFFILKAYRGRGVGTAAVEAALKRHLGKWHIATPRANHSARAFGQNAWLNLIPPHLLSRLKERIGYLTLLRFRELRVYPRQLPSILLNANGL